MSECNIILSFNYLRFEEIIEFIMHNNVFGNIFVQSSTNVDDNYNSTISSGMGTSISFPRMVFSGNGCMIGYIIKSPHNLDIIQPVEDKDSQYKLWHNGIIKPSFIQKTNELFNTNFDWDTKILLEYLMYNKEEALRKIDGSFACILLKEGEYIEIFHNDASPLYYTMAPPGLAVSTISFPMSLPLKPNTVWRIDIHKQELVEVQKF
jgi:hypothetical protein